MDDCIGKAAGTKLEKNPDLYTEVVPTSFFLTVHCVFSTVGHNCSQENEDKSVELYVSSKWLQELIYSENCNIP